LQNLPKPTDRKHFETVTTLIKRQTKAVKTSKEHLPTSVMEAINTINHKVFAALYMQLYNESFSF